MHSGDHGPSLGTSAGATLPRRTLPGMLDIDGFVARCREALSEGPRAPLAVKEEIERVTRRPAAIEAAVGELSSIPAFTTWHRSAELTVLHVVWPPSVDLFAHDHRMWAAIGLYGGREDNHFFRRSDDGSIHDRSTGITLRAGESVALGDDTIHAVANPSSEWTGSIHAYGGDYFAAARDMWPDRDQGPIAFDTNRAVSVLEAAADAARP